MLLSTKVANCPSVHWNIKMYIHHMITILTEGLIQVIWTCFENWASQLAVHNHLNFTCQQPAAPHSARSSLQWMNTSPPTLVIWCVMMVAQYLFFPCACFWICLPLPTDCLPATCCWSLTWIKWSSIYPYILDFAFEVKHCLPKALQ